MVDEAESFGMASELLIRLSFDNERLLNMFLRMLWLMRYLSPLLPNWMFDMLTLSLSPVDHVRLPERQKVD